jgi:hypothetical protein
MKQSHDLDNLMKDYFQNSNSEKSDFSRKILNAIERENLKKIRFSVFTSCIFIGITISIVFAIPFFWYFSSQFIGAVLEVWDIPFAMTEHLIAFFALVAAPALVIIFIKTIRFTKTLSHN